MTDADGTAGGGPRFGAGRPGGTSGLADHAAHEDTVRPAPRRTDPAHRAVAFAATDAAGGSDATAWAGGSGTPGPGAGSAGSVDVGDEE
ncbi:hypothetical protein [Streptomyces sp. NBC_00239]|uniref:hypothetical protein n=1 Tax=Streptomyces sp. NBC_00239 TaxID=2903640 RepID=UPI002E29DB42|nr:hypothetical protein [Streptomyces sp. NBC_00239]